MAISNWQSAILRHILARSILVRWLSGRKQRFAKAPYPKRVPRVRIPPSPLLLGMDEQSDKEIASKKQRDQMLKLVAKGFYNELINYGVGQAEVITVASHLLDNLLAKGKRPDKDVGY
jgi:hypothetical protein